MILHGICWVVISDIASGTIYLYDLRRDTPGIEFLRYLCDPIPASANIYLATFVHDSVVLTKETKVFVSLRIPSIARSIFATLSRSDSFMLPQRNRKSSFTSKINHRPFKIGSRRQIEVSPADKTQLASERVSKCLVAQ